MNIQDTLVKIAEIERLRDKALKEIEQSMFASIIEKLEMSVNSYNNTLEVLYKKYAIIKKVG